MNEKMKSVMKERVRGLVKQKKRKEEFQRVTK